MATKISKHRLHIFIAMFTLISFMLGCNEFMVVGNLTLIADTYNESLSQISGLVSVFAWTFAIMTPILAIFTNKIHKYYLLITLLVIFLFGTILSSIAPSYNWLLISRILTGSVAGMLESLLSVIAFQTIADPKQRSMAIAYIYTGYSIASVVGIPLGTIIANHLRWQDAFIMVAIITFIATIIALRVIPKNLPGGSGSYKNQLILLTDKKIWLGMFFVICAAGSFYGYYTYIRPLIRQTLHFSAGQLSFLLVIIGLIDIFGSQISGKIAAGNGLRTLRPIYLLDLVIFAAFSTMMQNQWTGIFTLFLLTFMMVLFDSPIQVFFLNQATEKYPSAINLASTLNAVFYNVGIALASMTGGFMLKSADLSNLGWNSFGYSLVATVLIFLLSRRTSK